MKISNIIITASIVLLASCSGNQSNEHGHEHSNENEHEHGEGEQHEHNQQEEFIISGDSLKIEESDHHKHEDGSEHHNH